MTDMELRIRRAERVLREAEWDLENAHLRADNLLAAMFLMRQYTENHDPGTGGSGPPPCSGTVTLTIVCGITAQSGVSVTITMGGTSFTGTTNLSGQVTFNPGAAGTWTVLGTKTGFTNATGTFAFACANAAFTFSMASTSSTVSGSVFYCGSSGGAAVTVTVSDGSGVIGTQLTNGAFSIAITAHSGTTVTISASGPRLQTVSTTRTLNCGGSVSGIPLTLPVQSGYRCVCTSTRIADANTLTFSSTGYSCTLIYGTSPHTGNTCYYGSMTVTCRAVSGSPCTVRSTTTVTLYVEFDSSCNLSVYFKPMRSTGSGVIVCRDTTSSNPLPISDAYCATLPAFPGGPTCFSPTTNAGVFLASSSGPPSGAAPFMATYTGVIFRDADDAAFLTDAVVSE